MRQTKADLQIIIARKQIEIEALKKERDEIFRTHVSKTSYTYQGMEIEELQKKVKTLYEHINTKNRCIMGLTEEKYK